MLRFVAPTRRPLRFAAGEWNRYEDLAASFDERAEAAYLAGVEEARAQLSGGAIAVGVLAAELVDWLRVRNRVQNEAMLPYLGALNGATDLVDLGARDAEEIAARATQLSREYADRAVTTMRDGLREAMAEAVGRGADERELTQVALRAVGLGPRFAKAVAAYEDGLLAKGTAPVAAGKLAEEYASRLRLTQVKGAARTAMTTAVAVGQLSAWREAVADGRITEATKTWRVNRDGRTCARCLRLAGKRVPLDWQFELDGQLLDGPPLHHACRCVLDIKGKKQTLVFHLPGKHDQLTHGRGGGMTLIPVADRAFAGKRVAITTTISKQEAGALGERVVVQYLRDQGYADARPLNAELPNFAVDLVQDHEAIEVKTGLVSNGESAQQWRMTIGEPGKAEKAWLGTVSAVDKAAWNGRKADMIHTRKAAALDSISQSVGHPVTGRTITTIINPDTATVDLYSFEGYHSRIGWNSEQARNGYVGSFTYAAS